MPNTRIDIRNIRIRTIIGVNAKERRIRQLILVHVSFIYAAGKAVRSDSLKYAVDYRTMTHEIVKKVEASRFYLIERLTQFILGVVIKYPRVKKAKITVEKPGALRHADSVASTIGYRWTSS